jgi:EamA domain-containing membrane protein RarD
MILARVVLGEALPRLGLAAVALAVMGIVLISLGG